MVIAYTRTDQLMIKSMWGESALGFYSAAIRVSEALNFLPYLIFSAIFPIFY
ncbi:oligosaccharide flippase family protein [Vibrio parahaemolyticus]|nr:oligosaccharide flippase family protein [Vibrio parahaemolyticus]